MFLVLLFFLGHCDTIFFDELIKHMEEDGVRQSHANGIVAVANQLGEICDEHIQKGRVHGVNVRSGFLGKSVCRLERFTLVVVCAVLKSGTSSTSFGSGKNSMG